MREVDALTLTDAEGLDVTSMRISGNRGTRVRARGEWDGAVRAQRRAASVSVVLLLAEGAGR